jgi:hypothetical protein
MNQPYEFKDKQLQQRTMSVETVLSAAYSPHAKTEILVRPVFEKTRRADQKLLTQATHNDKSPWIHVRCHGVVV